MYKIYGSLSMIGKATAQICGTYYKSLNSHIQIRFPSTKSYVPQDMQNISTCQKCTEMFESENIRRMNPIQNVSRLN